MRHSVSISGEAFRLRPIADSDAPFILSLRGDPVLSRFLHSTPADLERQREWLAQYYQRTGDWYFVIERVTDGQPEGLVSLYDLSAEGRTAEWGRWILRGGSLAAVESAWLIYRCAFERLDLIEVYCRTVAINEPVVSFHNSCGITRKSLLPEHFEINGHAVDAIEHRVSLAEWGEMEPHLARLVRAISRRVIK